MKVALNAGQTYWNITTDAKFLLSIVPLTSDRGHIQIQLERRC